MSMKQELAALKKKRDAGDITAFKYRQGVRQIKKSYGVDAPSNVTKIFRALTTAHPRSAKAVAARKKANERAKKTNTVTVSDAQKKAQTKTKKSDFLKGLDLTKNEKAKQTPRADTSTRRAAPKFNPSGLKVPAKKKAAPKKEPMYKTIDPRTGKTTGKKVSAKKHLANIDAFKARIAADKARAKGSRTRTPGVMTEAQAKSGTATANKLLAQLKKNKKGKK